MNYKERAEFENNRLIAFYEKDETFNQDEHIEEIRNDIQMLHNTSVDILNIFSSSLKEGEDLNIQYVNEIFTRVNRIILNKPLSPIMLKEVDDWELEHQKETSMYYTHKHYPSIHKKTNLNDITSVRFMDTSIFKVIEVVFDENNMVIDNKIVESNVINIVIPKDKNGNVIPLMMKTYCEIKNTLEHYFPITETYEFMVRKIEEKSDILNKQDVYIILEPGKVESFRKMFANIYEDILVVPAGKQEDVAKENKSAKIIPTQEWRRK